MKPVGVFGGAFNPIRSGHLRVARLALRERNLAKVLLIPSGARVDRALPQDPGTDHRLKMVELACEGSPSLEASAIEIERQGFSYTVDTLRQLRETHPNLVLIIGTDQAFNFPRWHCPEEILALAELVPCHRPALDFTSADQALRSVGWDGEWLDLGVDSDLSSTDVRSYLMRNEELPADTVPQPVLDYIRNNNLYLSAKP